MTKPVLDFNIDLIKYPLITSKTNFLLQKNQYTFLVDPRLDKKNLKKTIEYIFKVKVCKVTSFNLAKKRKRIGQFIGTKSRYKKVIITLSKTDRIKLFSN